jgi:hypothetical protein
MGGIYTPDSEMRAFHLSAFFLINLTGDKSSDTRTFDRVPEKCRLPDPRYALQMGEVQGQGYIGQALGVADILAVAYRHALNWRPAEPEWEGRDRFLLSHGHYAIALALLSLAAIGSIASSSQFWALPTAFLGGVTAAAGIAAINCIANLAGFVSPSIVGWLNDFTGKQGAGLMFTSSALLIGAVLVLLLPAKTVNR